MCNEQEIVEMGNLTRRRMGALTIGASLMGALPHVAGAVGVKESDVVIKTPDGEAEAYFAHPEVGKAPGVLVWVDVFGLRPAFRQMGKRLAESGYAVLIPNPYYRTAKLPALPPGLDFAKPADAAQLMKMMSTLSPTTNVVDAKAFIDWLDKQAAVDGSKKMATTGYCMGGPLALRTAAERSNRVGATASFHGANLAGDDASSPHLLIPKMKGNFLIAIAQGDDEKQPTAKDVLRDTFAKNNLKAEIEVYPAQHGWCPLDMPVYNQAQAEKAWSRMLALFKSSLA